MLKLPITYTNLFTEKEVTEDHFFHISKADLVKLEITEHKRTYMKDGVELTGMQAKLQRIVDAEDGKAIMDELEDLILLAYGKKDGEKFRKSKEISDDFKATEAYSELLLQICTNADAASKFINGIVPRGLAEMASDIQTQAKHTMARTAGAEAKESTPAEESSAIAAVEEVAKATGAEFPTREKEIANATAENPVTLTQAEVDAIDGDELKSGLATGRIKLS